MKLHKLISPKRLQTLLIATVIAVSTISPIQASAYTASQVSQLNNQTTVSATLTFSSNQKVPVTLNGNTANLKMPAYVTSGRTLLPVRGIAELLNAQVNFEPNGEKGLVQITKDANEVLLQIGKNKIVKNGTMSQIDPANAKIGAATFQGTTYLPLRAVADALGVQVDYKDGKVNISTDGTIVPPTTQPTKPTPPPVTNKNLVPNTNPELVTEYMDITSPELSGDQWFVPEGLIYKNPPGLSPGDSLTMEQKKQLMPEMVAKYNGDTAALAKRNWVYVPVGARVSADNTDTCWAYTSLTYQGALGYAFRDYKNEILAPSAAFSGTVAHKDGTTTAFSSGGGEKIRQKGGMSNVKYVVYGSSYQKRNDTMFVSFYN